MFVDNKNLLNIYKEMVELGSDIRVSLHKTTTTDKTMNVNAVIVCSHSSRDRVIQWPRVVYLDSSLQERNG